MSTERAFLVILATVSFLTVAASQFSPKTVLNVGYLTAIKGDTKDRQGLAISGAIQMALEEVNNDPKILPNVRLELWWNDTRSDTVVATRAITEMICNGVSTIFGPEGTCHVEAIVTQSRNIPMIAYVSREKGSTFQ
jgi:guanylate cyclase